MDLSDIIEPAKLTLGTVNIGRADLEVFGTTSSPDTNRTENVALRLHGVGLEKDDVLAAIAALQAVADVL